MTREKAKKAAEVMLAYADGKEIQYYDDCFKWIDVNEPAFDWFKREYRIKQEPVVPFTFEDRNLFMGKFVRLKNNYALKRKIYIVVSCSEEFVWVGNNHGGYGYDMFLQEFEFENGSPCGKIVVE